MLNKSELMKKWNGLNQDEQMVLGAMVGASAGLLVRGLLKMKQSKKQMEVINLVVPKDCELMIFVKGGK